jgi:hypothetical protein
MRKAAINAASMILNVRRIERVLECKIFPWKQLLAPSPPGNSNCLTLLIDKRLNVQIHCFAIFSE